MPDDERKPVCYEMHVFLPGSADKESIRWVLKASAPFGSINRGDILNSNALAGRINDVYLQNLVLKVAQVEHYISDSVNHYLHLMEVYTEAVPDTPESRLAGSES